MPALANAETAKHVVKTTNRKQIVFMSIPPVCGMTSPGLTEGVATGLTAFYAATGAPLQFGDVPKIALLFREQYYCGTHDL